MRKAILKIPKEKVKWNGNAEANNVSISVKISKFGQES
jgi:hypothetical protein